MLIIGLKCFVVLDRKLKKIDMQEGILVLGYRSRINLTNLNFISSVYVNNLI